MKSLKINEVFNNGLLNRLKYYNVYFTLKSHTCI